MTQTKPKIYSQSEISKYVTTVIAIGSLEEILEVTTGLYSKKQQLDPDIYLNLANLAHEKIRQYDEVEAFEAGRDYYFIPVLVSFIPETPTENLKEICGILTDKNIPSVIQVYFDAVYAELERRCANG
ncbi:hypothetical protein [Listeria booriae]|uniref:hypothetical protein n=1 Tax=Listeria booriae TaxID=1552123 RepID=UPI0016295A3E|nr:hypothetical protein [Listeria booriae]MBC1524463.1 hypothetical protein [Listeria booriae]MBC6306441.1 hypothetical protein [Listeria booriae]